MALSWLVPRRRSRSTSRRRRRPAPSSTTSRRPERARTRTHIRTRTHARCAVLRNGAARPAPTTRLWCAQALAWLGDLLLVNESVNDQLFVLKLAVAKSGRAQPRLSVRRTAMASPRRCWGWVWLGRYKEHWKHLLLRYGSEYKGGGEYRAPGEPPRISLEAVVHFCTRATILPAKIDMANVLRIFQARPRPAHAAPPRPCGPAPPTRPRPAHAVPRRSAQRAAWDTAVGTEATPLVPVPPRAASACPAHARTTMSIARRNARARTYDWLLQRGRPQLRSLGTAGRLGCGGPNSAREYSLVPRKHLWLLPGCLCDAQSLRPVDPVDGEAH